MAEAGDRPLPTTPLSRTLRGREDLGNSIVNFARIVPDGLLVFFPSYGLLDSCVEGWKLPSSGGSTIWERICR